MRSSDWSSDVCSSDLTDAVQHECKATVHQLDRTHVRFVKIGMTNHRLVEGDERQKRHGCLHFLDLAERGAGFKMRLAIEASANLPFLQPSKQGGDVEHRHRRPDTVILIEFPAVPPHLTCIPHSSLT